MAIDLLVSQWRSQSMFHCVNWLYEIKASTNNKLGRLQNRQEAVWSRRYSPVECLYLHKVQCITRNSSATHHSVGVLATSYIDSNSHDYTNLRAMPIGSLHPFGWLVFQEISRRNHSNALRLSVPVDLKLVCALRPPPSFPLAPPVIWIKSAITTARVINRHVWVLIKANAKVKRSHSDDNKTVV